MSDDEHRVTIAEIVGYRKSDTWIWSQDKKSRVYLWDRPNRKQQQASSIPDYLGNLNAIHDAWVSCIYKRENLEDKYIYYLGVVCGCPIIDLDHELDFSVADWSTISNVTAAQRSEAFLHTFNRYKL